MRIAVAYPQVPFAPEHERAASPRVALLFQWEVVALLNGNVSQSESGGSGKRPSASADSSERL